MNRANFPENRRRKQAEAQTRQAAYESLSIEERLRALDRRPGASKKERARLTA